jgi:hypothetical protein
MMRKTGILAVSLLVVACGAGTARAGQILWIDDAFGNIGTVDVSTGASTVIGNSGVNLTDIAFDPNGNLYGVSFTSLYTINTQNGHATLVGNLGDIVNGGANALVFAPNGTLYAASSLSPDLFTVNPATGAATAVTGTLSVGSAGDLAFNGGNLFLTARTNELIRVDNLPGPVSGTIIGPLGFPDVLALATGSDGVLYGVEGTQILQVNTTTGHATLLINYFGNALAGANGATVLPAVLSVPEPASLVMGCISVLVGLGVARHRRRNQRGQERMARG